MSDLAGKAARLLQLHHGPRILVLPNAWDAASARVFEQVGFPAIATTSAGIAAALGYTDGERISRDEMLSVVGRIARTVSVPVTADLEAGYGPSISDVESTALGLLAAGGVGLNFEDAFESGLIDTGAQIERIRAIRKTADKAGIPIVINARTDVFLREIGAPQTRFDETVRRAAAYLEAGANCIFVPGVWDRELIGALTTAIRGPLNILDVPGVPPASELEALGVARMSTGSGPMRAALTYTRRLAEHLKNHGTITPFAENAMTYVEVNRLMGHP